jgi:hypothetical protein
LVDNGSSTDILYKSAFDLMKISKDKLSAFRFPLVGFAGEQVMPLGVDRASSYGGQFPNTEDNSGKISYCRSTLRLQRYIREDSSG